MWHEAMQAGGLGCGRGADAGWLAGIGNIPHGGSRGSAASGPRGCVRCEACGASPERCEEAIMAVAPKVVILASGYSWVDGCERDARKAMAANRDGPEAIANAARKAGARTVFLSTDYVYSGYGRSGGTAPYTEADEPSPRNIYGESKLQGELRILGADPDALVIRTAVVYGPEENGKNFLYQVARTRSAEMKVPQDQVSNPTYSRDLGLAIQQLIAVQASGVFNVVGDETISRSDFAQQAVDVMHRQWAPQRGLPLILPVISETLNQLAKRPLLLPLSNAKLKDTLKDFKFHTLAEALQDWQAHPRGTPLFE